MHLRWFMPVRTRRHGDYTLNPIPYTLYSVPYTLHPTPYTLHLTPYTLYSTPYTLHLILYIKLAMIPASLGSASRYLTLKPCQLGRRAATSILTSAPTQLRRARCLHMPSRFWSLASSASVLVRLPPSFTWARNRWPSTLKSKP